MARVTVEDCIEKVPNRFELVLMAGQRARQISGGAELTIDRDRDKNPVVALREIADATVLPSALEENIVLGLQKVQIDDDDVASQSPGELPRQRQTHSSSSRHRRGFLCRDTVGEDGCGIVESDSRTRIGDGDQQFVALRNRVHVDVWP